MTLAERYRRFAQVEARGKSPLYEQLALRVADDPDIHALLAQVSPAEQQPNLLLAAVVFLGGAQSDYPAFRAFVLDHADAVVATLRTRRTQTNEVACCATLLPLLASLPGPLALLEVGASAGLCLLPDRYAYDYGSGVIGDPDSPVLLACEARGAVPLPTNLPEVVWRRGIDLNPIDVLDAESIRWLECCIWPDQPERLARFRVAVQVARGDPPPIIRGDLLEVVGDIAREAPPDATLVIFHSAVLAYLSAGGRQRFADLVSGLTAVWISNEAPGVVEALRVSDRVLARAPIGSFVIGRGPEQAVALADPHGAWLEWLP